MTRKWLPKILVFELLLVFVYSGFPACLNPRNLFRKTQVEKPAIAAPRIVPSVSDPMLVPRNIRGIVYVKFPENMCQRNSIVVILQGYLPDPRSLYSKKALCIFAGMAKSVVKKQVTRRDKNQSSRPHVELEISREAAEEVERSNDNDSWTALFPALPVAFTPKAIKIEPISFLEMENESMPQMIIQKQDSGTSRQKKKPKITNIKAALRMKQRKRIENPERYKENIADLPEYMYE